MESVVTLIKIMVVLFFSYITYDAFAKAREARREGRDPRFSPVLAQSKYRKQMRKGIFYLLVTLFFLGTLFLKIKLE